MAGTENDFPSVSGRLVRLLALAATTQATGSPGMVGEDPTCRHLNVVWYSRIHPILSLK